MCVLCTELTLCEGDHGHTMLLVKLSAANFLRGIHLGKLHPCADHLSGYFLNVHQERTKYGHRAESSLARRQRDAHSALRSRKIKHGGVRTLTTASVVNSAPAAVQPYLRLMRLDKPIGL